MAKSEVLDRILTLEVARVTEAAAMAAAKLVGRGDEHAADQAAVDAMRGFLNTLEVRGRVVIGEGERDEAPMLFIGEEVGTGSGPEVDIALDPLEGTTMAAKAMANVLAVIAISQRGGLLHAPDVYMDKIAIGRGYAQGIVDLDADPADNVHALAKAKGVAAEEITVCVLDRPRHAKIIGALRKIGARVVLISDGDVAGVIQTTDPATHIDMYLGQGGAPEGVLAAAALRCIGGQIQTRLVFRNDDERARAAKAGITDLNRKYALDDMVKSDVIFSATGVTDGAMLEGVHVCGNTVSTHTVVMRSSTGTVRWIKAQHRRDGRIAL
jgi:fructose-1,6-bisphosphatase II / sedoheptulose-1,7-bisphosphatase